MADILCSRPCSFFQELIFVMSLYWILFQTNETALVKVMTWHITGSKTLREPVITQFTDPCTCFTSHNDVMSYKRFVYYWYLLMGIPQLQVTSEFYWDRDIYVEPWCFLCCKPKRDVEQTAAWSVKRDSLTSSWYTVIISNSIDQCNGLIPNRTKAIA